ncbi:hypothetical protein SALB_07516 [Streptomyces noursei]|uniref:Uncharacterized protein n=1 Tax=Streptomyces noursei TaxID=1971 RepID=A0A401RAN5_STRNR|nr:hypothetical protein SALB_07516 [Streptomyces noursei]
MQLSLRDVAFAGPVARDRRLTNAQDEHRHGLCRLRNWAAWRQMFTDNALLVSIAQLVGHVISPFLQGQGGPGELNLRGERHMPQKEAVPWRRDEPLDQQVNGGAHARHGVER